MSIERSIKAAWIAVEQSGVPEHPHEIAFREALRSQLARQQQPSLDDSPRDEPRRGGSDAELNAPLINEATVRTAVAEHTGVAEARLEKVFQIDDATIKLVVNHSALGNNAAEKTRTAAQIITVVRKLGLGENDTAFDIIRDECIRKHIYDPTNFASKHLPNITGFVVKGDGKNRRLEARTSGIEGFPSVIDRILGD